MNAALLILNNNVLSRFSDDAINILKWFKIFFLAKITVSLSILAYYEKLAIFNVSSSFIIASLVIAFASYFTNEWFATIGKIIFISFYIWCFYLTFPMTINHLFFETIILLIISTDHLTKENKYHLWNVQYNIICFGIGSLWFYSGVQKLFHGHYLNGEMFLLDSIAGENNSNISYINNYIVNLLVPGFGKTFSSIPSCCTNREVSLPLLANIFFKLQGLIITFAEIVLPLLLLSTKWRRHAIFSLILLQTLIAIFSLELDFAFTSLAALTLILQTNYRFVYGILFIGLPILPILFHYQG